MQCKTSARLGTLATVLAAAALLAACQTSPNASGAEQAALAAAAPAAPAPGAASEDSPVPVLAWDAAGLAVIGYFGAPKTDNEGRAMDTPQPNGFYRAYIGRDADGHDRVQDFYQATGTPLTSAFPIASGGQILEWATLPLEGQVRFYRPNGEVRSVTHYQNSQLHGQDVYFNADGSERSVFNWANDMLDGAFVAREPGTLRSVFGEARGDDIVSLRATGLQGEELSEEEALKLLDASLLYWYEDVFD